MARFHRGGAGRFGAGSEVLSGIAQVGYVSRFHHRHSTLMVGGV